MPATLAASPAHFPSLHLLARPEITSYSSVDYLPPLEHQHREGVPTEPGPVPAPDGNAIKMPKPEFERDLLLDHEL